MKQKTTFSLWKRLLLLLVLFVPLVQSLGQTKVYATSEKHGTNSRGTVLGLGGSYSPTNNKDLADVIDANLAVDGNEQTSATLKANTIALLINATGEAWLQTYFKNKVASNTVTYVKVSAPVNKGASLDLGKIVGGLLGVIGEYVHVEVYNSNALIDSKDVNVTFVEGGQGDLYMAINSKVDFTDIRIKLRSEGSLLNLLGSLAVEMNVYETFYYTENVSCGKPVSTGVESSGLNINLLGGLYGKREFAKSIDDDLDSYSTLKQDGLVTVGVGGTLSQFFYFPSSTDKNDNVRFILGSGNGVLNLELLSGMELIAYNKGQQVYTRKLSGGLLGKTDILGLIQNGDKTSFRFAPGVAFDKVEIRLGGVLNVGLLNGGLNIYDVHLFKGDGTCPDDDMKVPSPSVTPFVKSSCGTTLGTVENVDFSVRAVDGNNESFATMYASQDGLLGLGAKGGTLQMKYNEVVPANATSYIRIDTDKNALDALLSGSLGTVVKGVTGLLLGDHYFEIEAYNDTKLVTKGSSINGFGNVSGGAITLVQDNIGRYYFAVTPDNTYTSITIKNKVGAILPTNVSELRVYEMCRELDTDLCRPAQFTSYDQKGLNLGVADLSKAGVKNPYFAIDTNTSNYSEINNGLLSVGGLVKQTVYFNQPSQVGDELKVRLQLDPSSLLSLDLLGGYKVVTYLGGKQQESFTLQQGLINNLNLLDLFKSGGVQTLTFDTKQVFDRVDVQASTVLTASVTPAIRLYDVKRVSSTCPEITTVSPFIKPVCATTVLSASNADDIDNIFSDNFDAYATINSGAGILLGLGGQYSGHIELGYDKVVKAGTTSYIRFDYDKAILDKLVSGSLGNLVSGLVDALLLGNHYFKIDVKDANGASVLQGSSKGKDVSFKNQGDIRIVRDKEGRTYLAITPTVNYKSVLISDHTDAAAGVLAQPNTMNIYSMCYESDTNSCVPSFATSYEYTGLGLTVDDLSGAGVTYPERAIDGNSTHYSEISSGTLNIAGAVRQYIYFNSDAKAGEETLIKFKTQGGQVNLDLIGALEIKAYKGEKEVDALSSTNGLINGINVLDLLTTGQMVELPFRPKAAYDRISIGMKSLVGVNVGASIYLYDVARTCRVVNPNQSLISWKSYKVNNDATINTVKGGEVVEYTIHVRNEGTTPIADFIVKDKMPEGVSYESSVEGTHNNGEVIFSHKGSLAPGATTTFNFKVNVNASLKGIVEIKNIAYVGEAGQEVGKEVFYPSYPPVDNTNPTQPDGTKAPGTVIKVVNDNMLDKPIIIVVDENDKEISGNTICAGSSIILKVKEAAETYQWYFNGEAIVNNGSGVNTNPNYGKERTLSTETPGDYTVVTTKGSTLSHMSDVFEVIQNEGPTLSIEGSQRVSVKIDSNTGKAVLQLPNVQTNGSTLIWYYDNEQVQSNQVEFNAVGNYTLTVYSELNGCESYDSLLVTVFDDSLCPPTTQRVYARGGMHEGDNMDTTWYTTLAGFVANKEKAVDGDPTTHSTISSTVALLGLGTTWQNIYFDHPVKAGTPVTIKLGKEYSGLIVAGGMSVVGLTKSGKRIGTIKPVAGGLLDLLTGDNVLEYTFVPSSKNGPQEYYGVQISLGALVGVAQLAKVYGVYYDKPVASFPQGYCEPVSNGVHSSVLDVLHGVQDLGLGVASATASVVKPWDAVDDNLDTYATISRVVSVANQAHMTVVFKQQAMPGDELHIVTGTPSNPVLGLELIKAFKIQRYLGDKKVGQEIDGTRGIQVIDLKLLGLGYKRKYKMIIKETDEAFDRVKITYADLLGVIGEFTRIYEVSLAPKVDLGNGFDINEDIKDICEQGNIVITSTDSCTDYQMFTQERDIDSKNPEKPIVGKGESVTDDKGLPVNQYTFKLPKDLQEIEEGNEDGTPSGIKYKVIYVQTYRNGCPVGRRIPIKLNTKNCSVKTNLNITHKIK